jgi:hypothetical protein
VRVRTDRTGGRLRGAGASPPIVLLAAALASLSGCGPAPPRFARSFDSPRALAGAVLAALEAGDRDAMESLALSELEFREQVFPEMPAYGHVPMNYVWGDLRQKSRNELKRILHYHGGRAYEVEDVVFDGGATAYETFVVHRKPRLLVRERSSLERKQLALFGSVIETAGRYKLFSYVVNR